MFLFFFCFSPTSSRLVVTAAGIYMYVGVVEVVCIPFGVNPSYKASEYADSYHTTVEPHYNGHLGTKSSWLLYRGGLFTEWHSKSS